jgi:hypothetical protein
MNGNGHGSDDALFDTEIGLRVIPTRAREGSSVAAPTAPSPTDGSPEPDASLPESTTSLVFGEPHRVGDKTIISAAGVQTVYRASGGAPIYSQTTPVAIIEVDDNGVRVKPIANARLSVLVWALTLAWVVYWLLRTVRTRQPHHP